VESGQKLAQVCIPHLKVAFCKRFSKATFERKFSDVS